MLAITKDDRSALHNIIVGYSEITGPLVPVPGRTEANPYDSLFLSLLV